MMNANVKRAVTDYLTSINREWDNRGIKANLRLWEQNKARLYRMLSNHPNWNNDELRFHVAMKYQSSTNWEGLIDSIGILIDNAFYYSDGQHSCDTYLLRRALYNMMREKTLSENVTPQMKEVFSSVGIELRVGQKITRAVVAGLKKLDYGTSKDYMYGHLDRWNELKSELLGGVEKTERWYYSINPLDYLSMSHGNSWGSCHSLLIDNDGCHKAGPLSYMNDGCTIVVYRQHKDDRPIKIERGLIWCDKNTISTIERIYPAQQDSEKAERLLDGFTQFFGEYRTPTTGVIFETSRYSHAYEDYDYHSTISRELVPQENNWDYVRLTIGNKALCLSCGDRIEYSDSLYCMDCGGSKYVCECCGEAINEDYVYWVDGYTYCGDCVFYCNDCGEYHLNSQENEVRVRRRDGSTCISYICDWCLSNNYTCCDGCGEYYHNDLITVVDEEHNKVEEGCYCEDCYNSLADIDED